MSVIVKPGERLSYSQKLSRLAERLRDPEWRRYGRLLLTGKLMGVGLVLLFMVSPPACSLRTYSRKAVLPT